MVLTRLAPRADALSSRSLHTTHLPKDTPACLFTMMLMVYVLAPLLTVTSSSSQTNSQSPEAHLTHGKHSTISH